VWSPLNGVVEPGHPAFTASAGELNHRPKRYVWIGLNDTPSVASGNRPSVCTWGGTTAPGETAKKNDANCGNGVDVELDRMRPVP